MPDNIIKIETATKTAGLCMQNIFDSSNSIILIIFLYVLTYIVGLLILEDSKNRNGISPFNQSLQGGVDSIINSLTAVTDENIRKIETEMNDMKKLNNMRDQLNQNRLSIVDLTKKHMAKNTDSIFSGFDHQINTLYDMKSDFKNIIMVNFILMKTIAQNMKLSLYNVSALIEMMNKPIKMIRKIPFISKPPLIPNPIKNKID